MTVSKQIKSKISKEGLLTISLDKVDVTEPGDGEVLIKVLATPINPSDLGLLVGPADIASLKEVEKGAVVEMKVPDGCLLYTSDAADE